MYPEINGPEIDGDDPKLYLPLPLPQHPTTIVPGKTKVPLLVERANRGEAVFHPDDLTMEKMAKMDLPPNLDSVEPIFARFRGRCSDSKYIPKCLVDDAEDEQDDEKEDPDPSLYSWWRPAWGPRPPEPPESYLSPDTLEEIRQMQEQQQEQVQREREQQEQQQQQHAQQPTVSPASTTAANPMPIDAPKQRKKPGPKPGFRKKQQQQSHDVKNGQHRQKRNGQRKQYQRHQHSSHSSHSHTRSWFDPDPEIDSDTAGALYTLAKKLGGLSQVKRACEMLQECAK